MIDGEITRTYNVVCIQTYETIPNNKQNFFGWILEIYGDKSIDIYIPIPAKNESYEHNDSIEHSKVYMKIFPAAWLSLFQSRWK